MMKNAASIKRISLLVSAFLILGYVALQILTNASQTAVSGLNPTKLHNFGGPYELVNQLGDPVTEKNLEGRYQLVYFGFTYCPAICPTELAKITKVLNALGDDGDAIQPVFISVDPERDTPDVIKDYLSLFHPRFVGYTGTQEQIETVKVAYKVYSAKVEDPSLSEYTVDHSSYIYFIDPKGQLLSLFKMDDTTEKIVQVIRQWLDVQSKS